MLFALWKKQKRKDFLAILAYSMTTKEVEEFEKIYRNIRTTDERARVEAGIETLLRSLYHPPPESFSSLIDIEMPVPVVRPLKESIMHLAEKGHIESIKSMLERLQGILPHLHVLSLEVAFDPSEETIALLASWIRKHIGTDTIMDLSIDRTLLAGVRLAYAGLYKEINLSHMLENVLQQKEEDIHRLLYE